MSKSRISVEIQKNTWYCLAKLHIVYFQCILVKKRKQDKGVWDATGVS